MRHLLATAFCLALAAPAAQAASFSFTGSFSQDDDVQLFNFSVGATSTVTLRSYSYAGGTMADGTVISAGGFDPILALFDSAGELLEQNDDGASASVTADPVTGSAFDTLLSRSLAPGDYTVSVMQYNNFATGSNLSDGFDRGGDGNFTPSLASSFGEECGASAFCDVDGDSRSNAWAFGILNVDTAGTPPEAPIPLPATLPMLAAALGGLGFASRRRRG